MRKNSIVRVLGAALVAGAMLTAAPRPALAAYPIQQYLQMRTASAGVFTPDGKQIVFSTNITGVPQLWRVPREGGWPEQLTFFPDAVKGAVRSPKGDWFLFAKDNGGDERTQLNLISPDGSRTVALTNNPKAIHTFGGFSPDGKQIVYAANSRDVSFFDLYVMDLASRKSKRVLTQDGTNYALAWSPDGKGIVFSRVDTPSNANLYWLDLATGAERLLTPHTGNANYESVAFGKDGKLYFSSDEGREFTCLASLDPADPAAKVTFMTRDAIEVEGVELSDQRDRIAYLANRDGYSDLYLRVLGTPKSERVTGLPQGVISHLSWAPDGKSLVFTFSGPQHNYDVWTYDLTKKVASQVTKSSLAGIPRSTFVAPSLVKYPSFDGRQIPAFLYLPQGATKNKSLPVLVYVHGGPESQERPDFASSFQYYLSRGYAMLALNIRGSTGYGKTYTHLDDTIKRKDAIKDVEYAVRYLNASGYANPKKIAIMGGSYGGYMTLAALTMLPDLWAAGVDTVGMSNLVTFLENTGPWRRPLREAEYGSLEYDRDFLEEVSPINHVDQIKAPLMVIQGANDPRVPKSEADQIVATLRERNHPVEYLVFNDEGHGVVKLNNRIKSFTSTANFLDKYVKNRK
ncbi:S9 family peptidase [bacterium]|nr:S9 family peptidase [bacterium]